MTGAFINMGMRAAIYEEPLKPNRTHAIRGGHVDSLNVSIALSLSFVVNKPHASGPTIRTDLRPRIRGSSNKAQSARDRIPANRALRPRAPEMSRSLIHDAA